jgi:hypothetical protein
MGGGYLTQPFYHMAPRQTMPYSTSDFGFMGCRRNPLKPKPDLEFT